MIPLRVAIEGFLSYREKQTIDFDGSTLWMLWGPNGVGKSAIFDAITFALFGAHRANKDARTPKELINHHADRFVIEFDSMVEGKAYRVYRCYPRQGRSIREAFEFLNYDTHDPDSIQLVRIDETDSNDGFKKWVDRVIGLDYQSFTSSVLLLQGKSEQLLNADPIDRYRLLADLIDLSRYQRLFEQADRQRKKYRDESDLLTQQLQSPLLSAINDDDMASIELELRRTNAEWKQLHDEEQQLTSLIEQAKHWEQAVTQLQKEQDELQNVLDLLSRENEITHNFVALQQLRSVLPLIRRLVELKNLASEKKQHIADLQDTYHQFKNKLDEFNMRRENVGERVNQLAQTLAELQNAQRNYADRLIILTPLVKDLEQIEKLEEEREDLDHALNHYPSDIEQQLEEADQQLSHLIAIAEVLPWLKTFAQARNRLSKALQDTNEASKQNDNLLAQLRALESDRAALDVKLSEAIQEERNVWEEKTQADKECAKGIERLTLFEQAATKQVCELCGQEIKGDHAKREKERLQELIVDSKHVCDKLAVSYSNAQEQLQKAKEALVLQDEGIKQCTNDYNQNLSIYQQAQTDANQQLQLLCNAYQTIKHPFKEYIASIEPSEDSGWLSTAYPTESDVETLQQQFARKAAHESLVRQLREDYNEWQTLLTKRVLLCQQMDFLAKSLDAEAATKARHEKYAIEQKRDALDAEILGLEQEYQLGHEEAQQIEEEYKILAESLLQAHINWEAEKAALGELDRTIQKDQESLPETWLEKAKSLDAEGIKELEQNESNLSQYGQLHDELQGARQSRVLHEQRIDELNDQIVSYPLEAQCAASDLEKELENKKGALNLVDQKRTEITQQQVGMVKQREQRQELEKQKSDADRKSHLYKILADLLGRSGLQAFLMRRAEGTIVDLANRTLSGLSHSRMRLELRRDSDASSTLTDKALDLVVYDFDTGQHAIPIGLVSGSQRFRIAVSLALAIGRSTSHEARQVESVIIDEGFGSLDKAGRDDMIQELNALREQLKRIILVSHQDEFAYAFPDRYSFKLVSGASHVSLVEDD